MSGTLQSSEKPLSVFTTRQSSSNMEPTRFAPILGLILLLLCCISQPNAAAPTTDELKGQIKADAGFIKGNVFNFWQRYGLDSKFGGFHGTLDRSGTAVSPTNKAIIQQARHIWAFSTFHQQGYGSGAPSAQQMAQSTFDFVVQHMRDPKDGLWFTSVTREGDVVDSRKQVMGQWFVLYGFSQYFQTFDNSTAKDLALSTFQAADSAWHNANTGGYNEGSSRRTLNTLMHGTEALTALHKVTQDETVLRRLLELVDIIASRLARSNGLVSEEYTVGGGQGQWTPVGSINYGHNLEVAWLIAETLDYLLSIGKISSSAAADNRATAMSIGATAVQQGFDYEHGGIFESPSSKVKIWWVQAESMLGMAKLYLYGGQKSGSPSTPQDTSGTNISSSSSSDGSGSGTQPNYLQLLADTARFVKQYQTDNKVAGEQFWQVNADGSWSPTGDPEKDTKGNRWKASYHSSRAPTFLEKWL